MSIYALGPLLVSLATLGFGTFALLSRAKAKLNRLFFGLCVSVFLWAFGYFLMYQTVDNDLLALRWARFGYIGVPFIPVFVYHFLVTFLDLKRPSWTICFLYTLGFLFVLIGRTDLFLSGMYDHYFWGYYPKAGPLYITFVLFFTWVFVRMVLLLYLNLQRHRADRSPLKVERIKYVLVGFALATTSLVDYVPNYGIEVYPWGYLSAFGWLICMGWASFRYRLMDINLVITRTAVFMIVYAAVLGLPLLAALSWRPQLEQLLGPNWWVGLWIVCSVLATAAHYANLYFQQRATNRILAEQRRYQAILRQASQGMTLIKDLGKLLRLIAHLLTSKVRIKHAAIYLWDERTKHFISKTSRQWNVKNPPSFELQDPLIEFLYWHRVPLVTEELQMRVKDELKDLRPVLDSLKTLDAAVIIPSFVEEQCQGLLILGEKNSGALYTQDDLQVFQVLASQAALAIENAQFYEELKRTQADLFQTAKMASLGHMAGGMSHQINNRFHVLTILAGTLKSVLKDMDPTTLDKETLVQFWNKTLETLNKVEENSLRGGDIVKTLLKFSRPSGEYKPVGVPKILSTAKEVVQFRVNFGLIDLIEEIPEDLPPVRGDLNQLADCCINLIANANDAIQKKAELIVDRQLSPSSNDPVPFKGWIKIQARVEKEGDKTWVILRLNDNGIGMTQTDLDSLFIPFFTTKATVQKGTGLGLYIIDRIMEQHGGRITATSEYGVGTTFVMRMLMYQGAQKAESSMQKAG